MVGRGLLSSPIVTGQRFRGCVFILTVPGNLCLATLVEVARSYHCYTSLSTRGTSPTPGIDSSHGGSILCHALELFVYTDTRAERLSLKGLDDTGMSIAGPVLCVSWRSCDEI